MFLHAKGKLNIRKCSIHGHMLNFCEQGFESKITIYNCVELTFCYIQYVLYHKHLSQIYQFHSVKEI